MLLDHLHISHLAAAFELEAKSKIGNAIGSARTAILKEGSNKPSWHERLVRSTDSFEGLRDIEYLIAPRAEASKDLAQIRKARNNFSHGVQLQNLPRISPESALARLIQTLDLLS